MILGFQRKAFCNASAAIHIDRNIQTFHVDAVSTGLIHWKKPEANLPSEGCRYTCKKVCK